MSSTTTTINGTNGSNGNTRTYKIADQLNGASSHTPAPVQPAMGVEPSFKAVKETAHAKANQASNVASQAEVRAERDAGGVVRGGVEKVSGLANVAVETTAKTVGYVQGLAKTAVVVYVNGAVAVIGYTTATAAHAARIYVDTTANITGYAAGTAGAITDRTMQTAADVTGRAMGSTVALADKSVRVAHETAKKFLPASIVSRAESAALVAQRVAQEPMTTARVVLPEPIFGVVAWGVVTASNTLDTANQIKDRTVENITGAKDFVLNTASHYVNTAREKLMATEDFAYGTAVRAVDTAKVAVGYGGDQVAARSA
ncbi:hypothetical protein HK104_004682 [Borealophlyctis nickersoniae]|nr:hypothetical protein HK104_004682 [Borealophlyctis nickersoniae]